MYRLSKAGKVLVAVLAVTMLAGFIATIIHYASMGTGDPFGDVPTPVVSSFKYADVSGQDVSFEDLSVLRNVSTLTFDRRTLWPPKDKMPPESPKEVLEQGKYLGLGLEKLHKAGITGESVGVAFIGGPLLVDHRDLPENMMYVEIGEGETYPDWFSQACVSILGGKSGVAPGITLYYFAVAPGAGGPGYEEALNQVLRIQETLEEGATIKVVAFAGSLNALGNAQRLRELIQEVSNSGILVVHQDMDEITFTGAGCPVDEDRDDPGNYGLWSWACVKREVTQRVREKKPRSWKDTRKLMIRFLTEPGLDSLQAEALNTLIYLMEFEKKNTDMDGWLERAGSYGTGALAVPVDFLTAADPADQNAYTYFGAGHLGFAVPYTAGVLALGFGVNPGVTAEEILQAVETTAIPFVSGHVLINPAGFIRALMLCGG